MKSSLMAAGMSSSAPRTIPRASAAIGGRQPGAHPLLGPPADRVEHSRHAVTPAAGQPHALGVEDRPDARPPQVGDVVEAAARRGGVAQGCRSPRSRRRSTPRASADPLDRNWTRSSSAVHGLPAPDRYAVASTRTPAHAVRDRARGGSRGRPARRVAPPPAATASRRSPRVALSRPARRRAPAPGDGQDAGSAPRRASASRRRQPRRPRRRLPSRGACRASAKPLARARERRRAAGGAASAAHRTHIRTLSFSDSKRFGPMPLICLQVLDGPEAAVLLAPVEDLLGRRRPDALELVELLDRRRVQADGPGHGTRCRGDRFRCGRGTAARHACGHDHLLPVRDLRRQVHALQVGPCRRAARAPDRRVQPRPRRDPVDARAPHRPGDVHVRRARRPRLAPP